MSLAKACRIRGAPIILPSADDNVAANTPALISQLDQAISAITSGAVGSKLFNAVASLAPPISNAKLA